MSNYTFRLWVRGFLFTMITVGGPLGLSYFDFSILPALVASQTCEKEARIALGIVNITFITLYLIIFIRFFTKEDILSPWVEDGIYQDKESRIWKKEERRLRHEENLAKNQGKIEIKQ